MEVGIEPIFTLKSHLKGRYAMMRLIDGTWQWSGRLLASYPQKIFCLVIVMLSDDFLH